MGWREEAERTKTRVPIVGGPRDGDIVPYAGPVYLEPVPIPARAYYMPEAMTLPPTSKTYEVRRYDLHHWRNEYGRIEPRYVLHEQAEGLGAT